MKLIYKKILWVLLGIIAFFSIIFFGALVAVSVNLATIFWGKIFPQIVIFTAYFIGVLLVYHGITLKEKPEYDLEFLKHAVINQVEADIEAGEYDSLDKLLTDLTEFNHELLYEYLSETGKANLKDGITHLRY